MAKKIIWSPRSVKSFERTITYLKENWSEKEIRAFVQKTDKVLEMLSSDTIQFRTSSKRNIQEVLITKHNLLLFRKKGNSIELLVFWNTFRNPKTKLK